VDLLCCNSTYFAVKYVVQKNHEIDNRPIDEETFFLRQMRLRLIPNSVWAIGSAVFRDPPPFARDMRALQHDEVYVAIVMPYIASNTLRCQLASLANLSYRCSLDHVRSVMGGIVSFSWGAYQYKSLAHGDLKLGNVLVNSKWAPTVVDFSFAYGANVRHTTASWGRGTPCYMPPERWFFDLPCLWMASNAGTCNVGDTWAIGLIWTTMLLTGMPMMDIDDPLLAAQVTSPINVFNPEYTDTVFDLVPATAPWFSAILNEIMDREKPINVTVKMLHHGACLMLWHQVLYTGERACLLPGNDLLPGIEQTSLHKLLNKYARIITDLYTQHGHGLLHRARDEVKRQLNAAEWKAYIRIFAWNPLHRRGTDDPNPFSWLLPLFGTNMHDLQKRLAQAPPAPAPNEAVVPERFFPGDAGGLAGLIVHSANDGCALCKAPCTMQCGACKQKRCSKDCLHGHVCRMPDIHPQTFPASAPSAALPPPAPQQPGRTVAGRGGQGGGNPYNNNHQRPLMHNSMSGGAGGVGVRLETNGRHNGY